MRQSKSGGKTCVSSATLPPPIGKPQNISEAVEARRARRTQLRGNRHHVRQRRAEPEPREQPRGKQRFESRS